MIEIYTDGAYSSSRNQGGWAFVVVQDGIKIHHSFFPEKDTTNNRMEMQAVIEACLWTKEKQVSKITIFCDSMYVIGTMTKNWKRNKNVDLWAKMDLAVTNLDITWTHIKGHSKNKYNDLCDILAVTASHAT